MKTEKVAAGIRTSLLPKGVRHCVAGVEPCSLLNTMPLSYYRYLVWRDAATSRPSVCPAAQCPAQCPTSWTDRPVRLPPTWEKNK